MNTNKFLIGGIVGGIAYFLLGWVIYGMLLKSAMAEGMMPEANVINRPEKDMVWWALILGNFAMGFLMSYILNRAGVMTAMSGLTTGLVVGLLMALGMDMVMYSMMNVMTMKGLWTDIIAATVMNGLAGLIIGAVNGMGNKAAA